MSEEVKSTTMNVDISMKCTCPYCEEEIDLEDGYDEDKSYTVMFVNWVRNIVGADKINKTEYCCFCNKEFVLTKIER